MISQNVTIHQPTYIHETAKIGEGTRIGAFCDIGKNVVIGRNCNIQAHVTISNGCHIGDTVFIGPNTSLLNDKFTSETLQPVTIHSNVKVGGGVIIAPDVTIQSFSAVGAGSVVTRDVPQGVLVYGNPAVRVCPVTLQKKDKVDGSTCWVVVKQSSAAVEGLNVRQDEACSYQM